MNTILTVAAMALTLGAATNDLAGRYALDRTASDDPSAVVEAAVRDVSWVKRGRMRNELLRQLRASPVLVIRAESSGFVIVDDAGRSLRATPGEPAARTTTPQGEPATVEAMMRSDTLVLRVTGERGAREQRFAADVSGLTISTTYTVDALDAPLRVRTVYRREAL